MHAFVLLLFLNDKKKGKEKRWIRLRFVLRPSVGKKLGSCACIFSKTNFNKGIKMDQVEICAAAICVKQDGLM